MPRPLGVGLALVLGLAGGAGGQTPARLELTVSASGFSPKLLRLRKGETVELILRSSDREHCFAVDELRIEKRVQPGRETRVELLPERVGRFVFYSCLAPDNETLRGQLVVGE